MAENDLPGDQERPVGTAARDGNAHTGQFDPSEKLEFRPIDRDARTSDVSEVFSGLDADTVVVRQAPVAVHARQQERQDQNPYAAPTRRDVSPEPPAPAGQPLPKCLNKSDHYRQPLLYRTAARGQNIQATAPGLAARRGFPFLPGRLLQLQASGNQFYRLGQFIGFQAASPAQY